MPTPTGFQQAKLVIEGSGPLACWFNPNEYSISKTNEWTIQPIVGSSLPTAQFGGGRSRQLSLDLLFHADPDGDVTPVTDRLFAMMEVDSSLASGNRNQARPPTLTFSWGTYTSFDAVARSLSVQFTLFRPDGTPIRALAKLELVQVAKDPSTPRGTPAKPQNPVRPSGCEPTSSATATASSRSPTATTAMPPAGARSRRRTASTIRRGCLAEPDSPSPCSRRDVHAVPIWG